MRKIKKSETKGILLIIAILQIFLLINLSTAYSYSLSKTNFQIKNSNMDNAKTEIKNLVNKGLTLLVGFISLKQIGTVSAWDYNRPFYCCVDTTDGKICKTTQNASFETCSTSLISGSCWDNYCWSCCPETNDREFCKDTTYRYSDCAERLWSGTCSEVNCRVVTLNNQPVAGEIYLAGGGTGLACCPEMNNGAICQNILDASSDECAVSTFPTTCDQFSNCEQGCCIDEEEGLCTTRSTKFECESGGGRWEDEESCLINECQKGCCVLGNEVQFIEEKRCEKISSFYGFEKDFRNLGNELECLAIAASQLEGACILEGGSCSFVTEAECLSRSGAFSQGNLCSNPIINSSCEGQESVGCFEGKDEIFWFDSCGNRENIYSSDKDSSWNQGALLSKEESCNPGESNSDSTTCGNCDYFLGSKCSESSILGKKIEDGDFICKNMDCLDENNVERQNGESWCVYDSYIGEGKDTVGSRHWKAMCINGEVKIEGCSDYRGQICVESQIGDVEKFSTSSCVVNEGLGCLRYNSGDMGKCVEDTDCMIKNMNIADKFSFDVCVPRHPRGFDLKGDYGADMSKQLCGMASLTCDVIYTKDWKGNWRCTENCNCESQTFSSKLNDFCVSLGDCGTYVNYIGEGTNNARVSGAPGVSWTSYKTFAEAVEGQHAEPKSLRETLGALGSYEGAEEEYDEEGNPIPQESGLNKATSMLGTISGGLGAAVAGATKLTGTTWFYAAGYEGGMSGTGFFAGSSQAGAGAGVTNVLGSIGTAAIGAGIGAMIGGYIASSLGITGDAASVMTIAGATAGAIAGYAATTPAGMSGFLSSFGLGMAVFWAAIAVMVFVAIMGWGETKTVKVSFGCMPWQAPLGGDDCRKCDDDPLKPCSEYRCSSLGQACVLLNPNTETPSCENLPNDGRAPEIFSGEIEEDYEFIEIEDNQIKIKAPEYEGCIGEFTPMQFMLGTDEPAQCKFEFSHTTNYDEMSNYPAEQTLFTRNHSFVISMPSLDSLEVYNVSGDLKEMFGNMNMYVRCQDYYGNYNQAEYTVNFCVNSGPDLTPARIVRSEPEDKSYLKYNSTSGPLTLYMNEPAECKYSTNENLSYPQMEEIMDCNTDLMGYSLYGWECSTNLTNLASGENNFYIKCKDKPWVLTEADVEKYKERNINTENFIYTTYVSETELGIYSVSPQGEIEEGFEPISVDLIVKTIGGMENGKSACSFKFSEDGQFVQFKETFSTQHKQNFNAMMEGNYNIYVKCEDEAGNSAEDTSIFQLVIDSSPPEVVRAYKDGVNVKIATNENAECFYDLERCNFDITNATSMTTGFSTEHTAEWVAGQTYHINCADIWGNKEIGNCSIKISPTFFG